MASQEIFAVINPAGALRLILLFPSDTTTYVLYSIVVEERMCYNFLESMFQENIE